MSKDFVGMGFELCPVCGCKHGETVLVQTRLRDPKLNRENFTGWSMCPEHKAQRDAGYIALVEVKNEPQGTGHEQLAGADRTGTICHVRAAVWSAIFNVPVPRGGIAFVPPEVIPMLQQRVREHKAQQGA